MDLFEIDPDAIEAAIDDRLIDHCGDAELATAVSRVLARPRTTTNSFTLHAPLELMARARLLPRVSDGRRTGARARLVALAAIYDHSGEPVDAPAATPPTTVDGAVDLLRSAIGDRDAEAADRAAIALGRLVTPAQLARMLADDVVPLLGAAGHAPIALTQWPQVDLAPLDGGIIRHLLRELAAEGDLRFRLDHPSGVRQPGSSDELAAALAAPMPMGHPGFGVFLLIDQAERHDALAAFPGIDEGAVAGAFRLVLRRAANAMLTDDTRAAPYGWSHALTLPLALAQLSGHLSDATVALDAAITEWCGFRMAHGRNAVVDYDPAPSSIELATALATSPDVAAAAAWHHPRPDEAVQLLIDNAASSHDAHLVKYTVASLDAMAFDQRHQRLYLAAAAFLAGWWRRHPAHDDPLPGLATGDS